MQKSLLSCALIFLSFYVSAQKISQESESVKKVINQLFEGMRKGDSTIVRSVFYENAKMQSIFTDKTGAIVLSKTDGIDGFVKAVGTPHPEVWDERLLNYEIKIDGSMATAWTPYEFYRGNNFSHAGVDAFTLFKTADGWKIIYICDTRRKIK
jgi:hypothetical protein